MSLSNLAILTLLGLTGGIAGCSRASVVPAGAGATSAQVTGTVTYRERVALPPNAVIKIRLVDVSRADAAAVTLGEQFIEANGKQVPFAFTIAYDPADIDERMAYAVQARIEAGGQLLFISDQSHPVITRGAPRDVDLVLESAQR
jgi:putative lipoprotein